MLYKGLSINNLTLVENIYKVNSNRKRSYWWCDCVCGKRSLVRDDHLKSKRVVSCGCFKKKSSVGRPETHGSCKNRKSTSEYSAWMSLKSRCLNPNSPNYKDYGGRGITVCDRWLNSFENFLEDMGKRPAKNYSINRINNDLGYSPENCRWDTSTNQASNTRINRYIELYGIRKSLAEWSRRTSISTYILTRRLDCYKWSVVDALTLEGNLGYYSQCYLF